MRRLEVSIGGRFGKHADAKRKAHIWKNRLRPPALQQRKSLGTSFSLPVSRLRLDKKMKMGRW